MSSATEQKIIDAAVRLFASQGYDATSVQEIVTAAEVTKGALYHYFRAKDDLLFEIYRQLITAQSADMDRIIELGLSSADTVREILVSLVVSTAERVDETAVFVREMHRLDEARMTEFRAERRRYHETFLGVIEKGQADGEFSSAVPADTVVRIAVGVVNQLPVWYRPDGAKPPARLATEIADFVLAGLTGS
ncbi:TetR family transcriptional regulator [Lentzea flava]|uniref:TetR family transcriptional regulator n=1 Tax=Lentzea flava TaxID=103732 RepID=UPI001670F478|nr:TetR family transcriptional regulator [Lentzea flava]MCP2203675.1 transcriptional regulator, TetR family [Lentzea flava]